MMTRCPISPIGAAYDSPGRSPGNRDSNQVSALKGRNNRQGIMSPLQGFLYYLFVSPALRAGLIYPAPSGLNRVGVFEP